MLFSFFMKAMDEGSANQGDYDTVGMDVVLVISYVLIISLFIMWAIQMKYNAGKSNESIALGVLKKKTDVGDGDEDGVEIGVLKKNTDAGAEDEGDVEVEMTVQEPPLPSPRRIVTKTKQTAKRF